MATAHVRALEREAASGQISESLARDITKISMPMTSLLIQRLINSG